MTISYVIYNTTSHYWKVELITEMSDFEIHALLGNNAVYRGNSFLTFQDNLLVSSSSVKKCYGKASSIPHFSIYVLVFCT